MGTTKKFKKVDIGVIEQAFKNLNLEAQLPSFLIEVVNEQNKVEKVKEEAKAEEAKKRVVSYVYDELPEDEDDVEGFIEGVVFEEDWFDNFEGDLDDDGADDIIYFMIANKLYEVEIHCEAEWCSDWSVRANLPSTVSVKSITEKTDYEIIGHNDSFDDNREIIVKFK